MRRDIRLWTIESTDTATELAPDRGENKEKYFEDLLTRNPGILMPGLTLVARQAPVERGALDLLGIDDDGRMVVFELKKEKLARDSVAQVIDYCSYLDSLNEDDMAKYIVDNSGRNGIDKIEDFQAWYEERHGQSEGDLRPTRMMLIAFDADASAQRMVEFLNERGVEISIQTYNRYSRGEETLLVGHHDRAVEARTGRRKTKRDREEDIRAVNEQARDFNVENFWESVVSSLQNTADRLHYRNNLPPLRSGITFYQQPIKLSDEGASYRGSHSVLLEGGGKIRITFFPIAVHLCKKLFDGSTIIFSKEEPRNPPKTSDIFEQWYCVLQKADWDNRRAELVKLAKQVYVAWERHRKKGAAL